MRFILLDRWGSQIRTITGISSATWTEELNGEDWNIINYSSAKMDEYLTACSEAASDEDMISAYSNLQKYISQELPYVSLVFRKSRVYTGPRIDGSLTPALYNVLSGVEGLKIKE